MKNKRLLILEGHLPSTLVKITLPSIVGMFGMMVFNIVDTYFVGQLGALELAAISFTFPVVMVINSLVFGIGVAAMSLFSRAAGEHNFEREQILATSTLTLGITISIILAVVGYFTIEPIFRLLGADDQLIPLLMDYMRIWYLGAAFMVIPMLGDSILRGLGDTFTPAFVMMTAAMLNVVLDPLLIFGIGPFPAMGVAGAALATIISRAITAIVSILIQALREKLLTLRALSPAVFLPSWKELFHIGLPNSAVRAINPLGNAVFTAILAGYGHEVLAGYGVAAKLESVFLALLNAVSITATVFVGQNMGAKNSQRAVKGIHLLYGAMMVIGLVIAAGFYFGGESLGRLFNDDARVWMTTGLYLRIVPIGYGFLALTQIGASVLNVYHKPYLAGGLSIVQIAVIAVPGSFLLSSLMGDAGVFTAILLSYVLAGGLSFFLVGKQSHIMMA